MIPIYILSLVLLFLVIKLLQNILCFSQLYKLITSVGDLVNNAPDISDYLKVVFLPNYNIPLGQRVYPVADFEQISTTGEEVLGTSSMKFFLNGALTIRTFDDPSIEIKEEVTEENLVLFKLTRLKVTEVKLSCYIYCNLYKETKFF